MENGKGKKELCSSKRHVLIAIQISVTSAHHCSIGWESTSSSVAIVGTTTVDLPRKIAGGMVYASVRSVKMEEEILPAGGNSSRASIAVQIHVSLDALFWTRCSLRTWFVVAFWSAGVRPVSPRDQIRSAEFGTIIINPKTFSFLTCRRVFFTKAFEATFWHNRKAWISH